MGKWFAAVERVHLLYDDSRKWAELVESDKLMIFVTGYRYTAGIMGGAPGST